MSCRLLYNRLAPKSKVPLAMVMKRTRYGEKLITSARRQFKLSEPN